MDVWVTQVGTGQFYNLTRGRVPELVNPSVRTLGFSPDGALVTFWARERGGLGRRSDQHLGDSDARRRGAAVPRRGRGVRLVQRRLAPRVPHARARGSDVRAGTRADGPRPARSSRRRRDCTRTFRYGRRTRPSSISSRARCRMRWTSGASAHRRRRRTVTHHNARVSHPVLLDHRTLLYLAERSGRRRAVAAQPGCRASRAAPRERRPRALYVAGGERRRAPARGDAGEPEGHAVAPAARRRAGRRAAARPSRCRPGADSRRGSGPAICSTSRQRARATESGNWSTARRPSCGARPDARIIGGPEIAPDGRSRRRSRSSSEAGRGCMS